jgi:hypothetical protein
VTGLGPGSAWLAKPRAIVLAQAACYAAIAALGILFMVGANFVLEPQDGVTRPQGLSWVALALVAIAVLLLADRALHAGRRWGRTAAAILCILGVLAGSAIIAAVVVGLLDMVGKPTVGANIGAGLLLMAGGVAVAMCIGFGWVFRGLTTAESKQWFT